MRRATVLSSPVMMALAVVLASTLLAGCGQPSGTDPAAFGGGTSATAVSTSPGDCLTKALTSSCELGLNPAGPTTPYVLLAPAGGSYTVVARGGTGANADLGAVGGSAGLVITTVSVPPGATVKVWVASNASSFHVGEGYAAGGLGWPAPFGLIDSGGGGGSSAVTVNDQVSVVAGGGGGAGSGVANGTDVKNSVRGGNGGSGGAPAQLGMEGLTVPYGQTPVVGTQYPFPGVGGCANGGSSGCSAQGNGPNSSPQQGGNTAGGAALGFNAGGGGGGGYPNGGDAGGQATPNPLAGTQEAGGGGGGGGQNFSSTPPIVTASASGPAGSVMFLPAGGGAIPFQVTCVQRPDGSIMNVYPYQVPPGVAQVLAVVAGGNGGATSDPIETGAPGRGAVASGVVPVRAGQSVQAVVGCRGYGRNPSNGNGPSGGGGAGGGGGTDDGGGGGGGGALILDGTLDALNAGGGGGSGGQSGFNQTDGSHGGDAGMGWGRAGAGNGGENPKNHQGSVGPPGMGASSTQPEGRGDTGTSGSFANGGGGGGGGGNVGGTGGENGSGGGAGGSSYDAAVVRAPAIGMQAPDAGDGFVVILPVRPS